MISGTTNGGVNIGKAAINTGVNVTSSATRATIAMANALTIGAFKIHRICPETNVYNDIYTKSHRS